MSNDNEYPRWLFKGGDPAADHILVNSAEEEEAASDYGRPSDEPTSGKQDSNGGDLLSGTIPKITAALAELSLEQLDELHAAETAGKGRAGVQAAIDAERAKRAE